MDGVLELLTAPWHGVDDLVLVDCRAARQQGGCDGDSDGPTYVTHQVEDAAGIPDLFVLQRAIGRCADGDEDKTQSKTSDEDWQEERRGRYKIGRAHV